jgi:uncharacterized FlaG/YvyC family protein
MRSPKKAPPRSKEKLSNSEINLSTHRKSTEEREKPHHHPHEKQSLPIPFKEEVPFKKDKRSIEPTEKIVERINNNLQLLQMRIHQLFQEEIYEYSGQE